MTQIITAAEILFNAHPYGEIKRPFYLYVDEVGRFATRQLETLLMNMRKTGLRLILAHQHFEQIEDRKVRNAIKQGARIKAMFHTPSYDDRLEMVKALGYGGDIPPIVASYANQDLPKQTAIIKKDKEPPRRVRIPDVTVPDVSREDLDKYINEILENEWYVTARQTTTDSRPPQPRTETHRKTNSSSSVSNAKKDDNKWKSLSNHLSVRKKNADEDGGTERD